MWQINFKSMNHLWFLSCRVQIKFVWKQHGECVCSYTPSCITLMLLRLTCQSAGSWFAPPSSLWGTCWRRRWWDHPSCSPFFKRWSRGEDGKWSLLLLKAQDPQDRPTSDVSHRNLLPLTRFPMVMWKKVLPLHQFAMRLNGWFASTSLKDKRIVCFFKKRRRCWRKMCQGQVSVCSPWF